MDVDLKPKEDAVAEEREPERSRERSRDREGEGESKDKSERDSKRERGDRDKGRDRDRDSHRDSRRNRRSDHWEPERRSTRRSRSRSCSRRRSTSPKRRSRRGGGSSRSRSRSRGRNDAFSRSLGGPMNADPEEAAEFAKTSKREHRVYVGNLSYDVKYRDLMEFMRGAGEVLFAEVLITPTGVSKGCGIVEFASQEDAQRAIRELSEVSLLGRPVFIREDRETESRFGSTPVPGKMGFAMAGMGLNAGPPPRPSSHGVSAGGGGNQLYVGNLPYQAGWQDLKDLFRAAGNIVRADINFGVDGRPKGSGTVAYDSAKDAQNAITMYHGYDWYGRILEVREDRYAGLQGFRGGGPPRGGMRGGFGGRGLRGGPFGGRGFGRGGGGFHGGGGRDFSNQDLYADYNGPGDQAQGAYAGGGGGFAGAQGGGFGGGGGMGSGTTFPTAEPSQQIMVRNLPWSTANEDLVELFETTGQVELAEILFEGTRSKGAGVVQFGQVPEAETAIAKFQGYMYGGRPLDVRFNDRWHAFTPTAAKGGQIMADATA